jgi:hypothetical protein
MLACNKYKSLATALPIENWLKYHNKPDFPSLYLNLKIILEINE